MNAMNVKVVLICLLISQTSASFFDEFRGAMFSVEDSFGRLLSDVVSDVRETIGCTILAVKQVLALGGVFHESSDYETLCRSRSDGENGYVQKRQDPPDPPINIPPILKSRDTIDKKTLSERLTEELNESIASAHDKVMNIIEGRDAEGKMEQIKSKLENEGNRLTELSSLLHHELNNISENVKKELGRVEIDNIHPTVEGIRHDVKVLHEMEKKYMGTDNADEIHHILNQVLGILRGSNSQDKKDKALPATSNDNDADKTFALIENQFEIMEKDKKIESRSEHDNILDKPVETQVEESGLKEAKEIPLNFKVVAKKIMDETRQSFRFADNSPQEYEKLEPVTTEKIEITTEKPSDDATISPDYGAFFQIAPKGSVSRKQVVEEATNLIESSKRSDAIMKSYFNKAESVGSSVFDNPELLGFG